MNRLVLHHTGSEEGLGGQALEKQKILECFGIFLSPVDRMREAEQQKKAVYSIGNQKH